MNEPIRIKRNDDGSSWTVYYFGKEAGHIETMRYTNYDREYRAITKHNRIEHFKTIDTAKNFIIENYA